MVKRFLHAGVIPLVFIHGIKGARLEDDHQKSHWLETSQILGFSTPEMRLPLQWEGNRQKSDGLHVTEILDEITIVPFLYKHQIYAPFLKAMREWKRPSWPFAYDWRRDNLESAQAFADFLGKVKAEVGVAPQVVAHSMGGLISLYVFNQHPELFSGITFVGVPFRGGVGFLPDVHVGGGTGMNRDMLTPEVLFTFPSVNVFWAPDGLGFVDQNLKPLALDPYDVATWEREKLGLFARRSLTPAERAHFAKSLAVAKKFREGLAVAHPAAIPLSVVISDGLPTLNQVVRSGPSSVHGWDFESAPKLPGDGRMTVASAELPAPLTGKRYMIREEHADMLNHVDLIKKVIEDQLREIEARRSSSAQ